MIYRKCHFFCLHSYLLCGTFTLLFTLMDDCSDDKIMWDSLFCQDVVTSILLPKHCKYPFFINGWLFWWQDNVRLIVLPGCGYVYFMAKPLWSPFFCQAWFKCKIIFILIYLYFYWVKKCTGVYKIDTKWQCCTMNIVRQ